jgi:hypothetical protein
MGRAIPLPPSVPSCHVIGRPLPVPYRYYLCNLIKYFIRVGQIRILEVQKQFQTLLGAAVCAASHQHGSDAHITCGISGTMLKNDKAVKNYLHKISY